LTTFLVEIRFAPTSILICHPIPRKEPGIWQMSANFIMKFQSV